ncbi:MAG TPA: nucleotide exchange factor GrpE [Clostridiaceae bacterium]|nr:nucleotide exchange factor GrpE [Clostridiaceae bacterium]
MVNDKKKCEDNMDFLENNTSQDEQTKVSDNEQAEAPNNEIDASAEEKLSEETENLAKEIENLKNQINEKSKKCDEYLDLLQRTAAEFDNYKKRTAREKDALYSDAVCDVIKSFLPVLDSVDRALEACGKDSTKESLVEGIELIGRQIQTVLKSLGIEPIKSVGEKFNPELHNAVMHVEDEEYGQNVVVEEFQKGYVYKERVIRYSMVKVAN